MPFAINMRPVSLNIVRETIAAELRCQEAH